MGARFQVEHALTPAEAARRMLAKAAQNAAEIQTDASGLSGEIRRNTPFGSARARWSSLPGAVEVELLERPPFLPDTLIENAVRKALLELLSGAGS